MLITSEIGKLFFSICLLLILSIGIAVTSIALENIKDKRKRIISTSMFSFILIVLFIMFVAIK